MDYEIRKKQWSREGERCEEVTVRGVVIEGLGTGGDYEANWLSAELVRTVREGDGALRGKGMGIGCDAEGKPSRRSLNVSGHSTLVSSDL